MQTALNLLETGAGVHIAQDGVSSCNLGEVFVALQVRMDMPYSHTLLTQNRLCAQLALASGLPSLCCFSCSVRHGMAQPRLTGRGRQEPPLQTHLHARCTYAYQLLWLTSSARKRSVPRQPSMPSARCQPPPRSPPLSPHTGTRDVLFDASPNTHFPYRARRQAACCVLWPPDEKRLEAAAVSAVRMDSAGTRPCCVPP